MYKLRTTALYSVFIVAAVSGYFLWFAWPGLFGGFSFDDLMNLYRTERFGWQGNLADIGLFFRFSHLYRPLGTLFYWVMFEAFGFHALPYRIALYSVLIANLALGFALAQRLSGSMVTAALCILLFAYHGGYEQFFINTGYVFDALCFLLMASAMLYHVSASKPRLWLWCALYVLALNAKEIAVSLPVIIAAWELLQPRIRPRWWVTPAAGAAITVAFVLGRLAFPKEGLMDIAAYHPAVTLPVFLANGEAYLRAALYGAPALSALHLGLLAATAVLIALLSRNATMRLGLIWMLAAILPIVFIQLRPLASAYISFFGLTLFLAELIRFTSAAVAQPLPTPYRGWLPPATAVTLAALMIAVHNNNGRKWTGVTPEHEAVARIAAELRPWQQAMADGRPTIFLTNPVPGLRWNTLFLASNVARDPSLPQRRPAMQLAIYQRDTLLEFYPPTEMLSFNLVLAEVSGQIVECDAAPYAQVTVAELASLGCTQKSIGSRDVTAFNLN